VSVYVRAVRRAAEIVGIDALSSLLGRARADVAEWILLGNAPPVAVFLRAVDVISAHDVDALRVDAVRRSREFSAGRP
jgi:hypothetical protein